VVVARIAKLRMGAGFYAKSLPMSKPPPDGHHLSLKIIGD
jgi:hypothetical protein